MTLPSAGCEIGTRDALQHRPPKQAARSRHRQQCGKSTGTSGLPEHRDPGRIAAKARDVLLYPFERGHLVEKTAVRRGVVDLCESVHADAVVERDQDNAPAGERCTVVSGLTCIADEVAAAVDPDHHGEGALQVRRPDVHSEAIQDVILVFAANTKQAKRLWGRRAEMKRGTNAVPTFGRSRRGKTPRPRRRSGKRDTAEDGEVPLPDTFHRTALRCDPRPLTAHVAPFAGPPPDPALREMPDGEHSDRRPSLRTFLTRIEGRTQPDPPLSSRDSSFSSGTLFDVEENPELFLAEPDARTEAGIPIRQPHSMTAWSTDGTSRSLTPR